MRTYRVWRLTITYEFDVDGKGFNAGYEKAFTERSSAEVDMQARLTEADSITVWYDKSDPSRAGLQKENISWPTFLGIMVLLVLMLAYIRWVMLKYYALEMAPD